MTPFQNRLRIACLVALPAASFPAVGQQAAPVVLPDTVVAADRVPVPVERVNASVTVITRQDIERRQFRTLTEALGATAGVSPLNSGGPGKTTQVFVRGLNASHTVILVDGVRIADPSGVNGAPNLAHMRLENVERIEVVRGPMSTLYGSDAIAGVINIVTREGLGKPSGELFVEGGSFATFNAGGAVRGSVERLSYSFGFAATTSAGFSATPSQFATPGAPADADGYRNLSLNGRLGFQANDWLKLQWFGRFAAAHSAYDQFLLEDVNTVEDHRHWSQRVQADLDLLDGRWKTTLALSYAETWRRDTDGTDAFNGVPFAPLSTNEGRSLQMEWKNSLTLTDKLGFVFGFDSRRDAIAGTNMYNFGSPSTSVDASTFTVGGYGNLRFSPLDGLSLTVGGRIENHSAFGTAATFRTGAAYTLKETGTTVRASVGTAFKAPSLDQLYFDFPGFGFFANPNLKPERSLGYEAGVEQTLLSNRVKFGLTGFYNEVSDMIVVSSCGAFCSTLANAAQARTQGFETFVQVSPVESVTLRVDYTFTDAQDLTNGRELTGRPRHQIGASASWRPIPAVRLGAEVSHRAGRREFDFTAPGTPLVQPAEYTLVRLTASYDVIENVTLFGRIENLGDSRHQEPLGFAQPGITGYGGLRLSF